MKAGEDASADYAHGPVTARCIWCGMAVRPFFNRNDGWMCSVCYIATEPQHVEFPGS